MAAGREVDQAASSRVTKRGEEMRRDALHRLSVRTPFKGGDDEEPFRLIREGIVADAYAVGAVT